MQSGSTSYLNVAIDKPLAPKHHPGDVDMRFLRRARTMDKGRDSGELQISENTSTNYVGFLADLALLVGKK